MQYANYHHQDRFNNSSFDEIDKHHTYNPTFTNRLLRQEFLNRGIELNNPDVNIGKDVAFNLYHDGQNTEIDLDRPNYLIATENPFICCANTDRNYLAKFNQVFTWNSNLLNLPNVTKIFIPNQIRRENFSSFPERSIFTCIINANKGFPYQIAGDLYKERINVIRWYEQNFPESFSLFGLGWEKPEPAFTLKQKIFRRFKRLATQLFSYRPFPSYSGEIVNKSEIYSQAKFAYCYENVENLPDYISEKIFDSFFSGCVPIYWGANTIRNHIPKDCFIDRRDFKNMEELHKFLLEITPEKYAEYQSNIQRFLSSKEILKFDTSFYVKTIVDKICGDIQI